MKMEKRKNYGNDGITLIALMITIIVLLILAGVTLNLTLGEGGIFKTAQSASKEHEKSQLKEELDLAILDIRTQKLAEGKEMTREDLKGLESIGAIIDNTDIITEGEYKDYYFDIDENYEVNIQDKIRGVKPEVSITVLNEEEGAIEVNIQVIATTTEGQIESIESLSGAVLDEQNSSNETKIYKVIKNGEYMFKVKGTNGRKVIAKVIINNILVESESILEGISKINNSGVQKLKVIEKNADGIEEPVIYSLNIITHDGDLILDGQNEVEGATLTQNSKLYEFGDASDVATNTEFAKNTVVLKVNGDLTINENVTLTSVKSSSGYGGPKGMIIYCTGKLINNGTISMTARGAKAEGQNVYLWKNRNDGSYEVVPKIGASGGTAVTGTSGNNASGRARFKWC